MARVKQEENLIFRLVNPINPKRHINFKDFTSLGNVRRKITELLSQRRRENWSDEYRRKMGYEVEKRNGPNLDQYKVEVYELKKIGEYELEDVIKPENLVKLLKAK